MSDQEVVLDREQRSLLVEIARTSVRVGLETGRMGHADRGDLPSALLRPGATFVTLRRRGALLGCIGTMEAIQPLVDDVVHNAWSAAFADPRLPSVTWADFEELDVKISVLGPLEPLGVAGREQLSLAIEPGVDGLLVTAQGRRGTFLPSVWEQVGSPDEFLELLWRKAGLPPGSWPHDIEIRRYRTLEFGDS